MNIRRVKFKDIEQIPFFSIKKEFKKDFAGSAPAPFIGRFGYPRVNIGILSPQMSGDTSEYDSPGLWSSQQRTIGSIASLRYSLVNSRTQWNIKDIHRNDSRTTFTDILQEVGMAAKPVELEVHLKKQPALQFREEREIIPFGPSAAVQNVRVTANSIVDSRVEKIVRDIDLKAAPALLSLYHKGFEENFLTKLISVGNVGLKKNRKLVPTRWSITAVDDTIGKKCIAEIKDFPAGEYTAFFGGGWGNYYLLLFFPEIWSYELVETYIGYKINPWSKAGNFYSTDYESYEGRKNYAEETAGGYYAARLAITEKMKEIKRQHSCLALRFITPEYNVPLGVWVCREAARKALQQQPMRFASGELLLAYAQELIRIKFNFDTGFLLKESKLLQNKKQQQKLASFM